MFECKPLLTQVYSCLQFRCAGSVVAQGGRQVSAEFRKLSCQHGRIRSIEFDQSTQVLKTVDVDL